MRDVRQTKPDGRGRGPVRHGGEVHERCLAGGRIKGWIFAGSMVYRRTFLLRSIR